ncbi:hypothetical protein [Anaerocolumna chitinilytica]|uniref:Uncharacterized protein n=1 Tax=Anaerocolumna chitinilytica TaxID=1727145 RepID=A0A7M3SAM5_9FIRM|nr:hypothetical protein [Anaerocolumna chitinilytica]BCK01643.1 hypothetical protein bsdcttw_46830 [Anaerocolumna chitinilytica]
MTTKELDKLLNDSLIAYSSEIRSCYKEGGKEPVNEGDIVELARQTFYTMDEFRKNIIKYLESK